MPTNQVSAVTSYYKIPYFTRRRQLEITIRSSNNRQASFDVCQKNSKQKLPLVTNSCYTIPDSYRVLSFEHGQRKAESDVRDTRVRSGRSIDIPAVSIRKSNNKNGERSRRGEEARSGLAYSFHLDPHQRSLLPSELAVLSFLLELRHSSNAIPPFLPWHVADAFIYKYQCCRTQAYHRVIHGHAKGIRSLARTF